MTKRKHENCRGLSPFSTPCEKKGTVPLSADGSRIGSKHKQIQDQREPGPHPAQADGASPAVPRRLIELDYIAAVADAVSLEDWNQIVRAAVYLAKSGDFRARDWVAAYMTGGKELLGLAAAEFNGDTPAAAVRRAATEKRQRNCLDDLLEGVFGRAKQRLG